MKNSAPILVAIVAFSILLAGCGEEGRKEASMEDICKAYRDQIAMIKADASKTDEDKRNLITRLGAYSMCGSEADLPGGAAAPAQGSTPSPSDLMNRDAERRRGG